MTSDLAVMKCYEPIVTFDILARSKITKLRLLQKCPAQAKITDVTTKRTCELSFRGSTNRNAGAHILKNLYTLHMFWETTGWEIQITSFTNP